jgi:hypothetical protein
MLFFDIYYKKDMKIIISESQLKKLIEESGGYDDKYIMNIHAQSVQSPLLHSFADTVEILNNFIQFTSSENYTKQHILNFVSNLSHKIENDIILINELSSEIYLDNDFANTIKKYRYSLKKLLNYLKLLYSNDSGLSYDMTMKQLVSVIYEQIEEMQNIIEELSQMFGDVHHRYRTRLGLQ